MKERPILFSTEMVQAILQGRKTQTRRLIKTPRNEEAFGFVICSQMDGSGKYPVAIDADERHLEGEINMPCPYGKVGDVLWVRETWAYTMVQDETEIGYVYKADKYIENEVKWKPSIHMPKEACRLKLRITNVRVERLQDITDEDSVKEGVDTIVDCIATAEFAALWRRINGEQSWNDNPWVWVIEFEKL